MFAAFLLLFGTPVLIVILSALIFLYISPLFGIIFAPVATVIWGVFLGIHMFNNACR